MNKFEFIGSDEEPVHKIEIDGEPTIYYGSVFYGNPNTAEVDPYYLMDTNIFSYICKDIYPKTLIKFISSAEKFKLELNPTFAIAEQYRSAPNPKGFVKYYQKHLENRFGIKLSDSNLDQFCDAVESKVEIFKYNVEMIEDYLAIIKNIYHGNLSEGERVRKFLGIISDRNLPQFTFAIYVGLIFFFIKESDSCEPKLKEKVNDFLKIKNNYVEEKKSLHNGATDISIFLCCQEIAAASDPDLCTVASIVTSDRVVGHLLNNICIYSITNPVDGKHGSQITIRNSSMWNDKFQEYLPSIQEKLNRTKSSSEKEVKIRKINLRNEWFLNIQEYLSF
jgi:hypothetical protein